MYFSQRQGYIGLTLQDGQRFDLSPLAEWGDYLDQEEQPLRRSVSEDGNVFKWEEQRTIKLTW
jgi:hypothetical protein